VERTKFLHDVGELSALLKRPSALRYSNHFWNASATNKGDDANFVDFASKIGYHGNVC